MILLGDITLFWLALITTSFAIIYHKVAPWWKSEMGFHLMTFALAFMGTAWYLVGAIFSRNADPSQPVARIAILGTFAALFTWRTIIMLKKQCPWVGNKFACLARKRNKLLSRLSRKRKNKEL